MLFFSIFVTARQIVARSCSDLIIGKRLARAVFRVRLTCQASELFMSSIFRASVKHAFCARICYLFSC
ncbi:hypothetical protein BC940DRAFT_294869 [Gongronella butleri]|nr:hypothetical protein BC940DRAFT_294869 [Gongronella butleri]